MITAVHGHDIIDIVAEHPEGLSLRHLSAIVKDSFGEDLTFHTCCAEGMNLEELLEFLGARYKVRLEDDRVYPGTAPACDH